MRYSCLYGTEKSRYICPYGTENLTILISVRWDQVVSKHNNRSAKKGFRFFLNTYPSATGTCLEWNIWFTWTNGSNELKLLLLSRKAQTAKGDTPCEWVLSTVAVAGRIIPVVPFHKETVYVLAYTASSNIGHGVAYRATQAGYKYQIESYNTLTVMKWCWQQRQTTKDIQREWSPKNRKT